MKFFSIFVFSVLFLQMILYSRGETITRTIPAQSINEGSTSVCSDSPVKSVSFKWATSSDKNKLFSTARDKQNLDGEEIPGLSCGFELNPISTCTLQTNNINGKVVCLLFGNPTATSIDVTIDITFS